MGSSFHPNDAANPASGLFGRETVGARLLYRLIGFALQIARETKSQ